VEDRFDAPGVKSTFWSGIEPFLLIDNFRQPSNLKGGHRSTAKRLTEKELSDFSIL